MGGQKYSTQTGQSGGSSTTTFSPEVQAAYAKLLGQIGGAANTSTSNGAIQSAEGGLGGLAANGNANYDTASGVLGSTSTPTYANVGSYMNPFTSNVIDATMANMNELNGQQQQGVIGNAIAKGAYGGNRVGVAQGELARQQGLANNQTLAGLWSDNYNQALGAAQADKTANINAGSALTGLGSAQSGTTQNALAALLGGGQFDLSSIYNNLGTLAGSASALSGSGATTTSSGNTTQSVPQGNIWSQLLGAGLAGASLFKRDGGVVPGYAGGGVIGGGANDNYAAMRQSGLADAIAAAQPPAPSNDNDPVQIPQAMEAQGVANIKGWMQPKQLHAGYNLNTGGVVPMAYYRGGGVSSDNIVDRRDQNSFVHESRVGLPADHFTRKGYASGGRLSPSDIAALYDGILKPAGGVVGSPVIPPTPTVDTTNAIDGDRLGLGLGNGDAPDAMAFAPTPDDSGMNQPPTGLHAVGASAPPSGGVAGGVPFSTGDQFVTAPAPGYSQNIGDAWSSLTSGNGLNLAPDTKQALLAAGLGMMSSKSPFALAGIGEGGKAGLDAWNERQKLERDNATARATNAKTGSDIALQAQQAGLLGAQTGREKQATAIDQYSFTPSMAGMVISDKVNPKGSFVIPYDQLGGWAQQNGVDPASIPNAPAAPKFGPDGVSMDVTPPADAKPSNMAFSAPEMVTTQTATALTDARKAYTAAQEAGVQLGLMKESEKTLPKDGFLSPGTWASERASFAKQANSLSQVLGLDPVFDPNAVSASEELHKLTTQFGFALSRTTGSDIASSVVNQAIGAVPSIENTPQGFNAVVSSIQAGLNRQKDYYQFLQKWSAQTGGDITGADEYFNKVAPPSAYANAAVLSAAVVPKSQAEIDNAPAGTLFNINGKLMQK